jgi:hypothetical protein
MSAAPVPAPAAVPAAVPAAAPVPAPATVPAAAALPPAVNAGWAGHPEVAPGTIPHPVFDAPGEPGGWGTAIAGGTAVQANPPTAVGGWGTAIRSRDPPSVFDAPGEPGAGGWGPMPNPAPAAANPAPVDPLNPGGGWGPAAQIAAPAAANPAPVGLDLGWAHAPPAVGPNPPAQPEPVDPELEAAARYEQQTADALLGYAEWAHLHGLPPDPTVLSDHEIRVDPSAALRQYEAAQNPPRVSRR